MRRGADLDLPSVHPDHLRAVVRALRLLGLLLDGVVCLDHLDELEHRLVVLVLVRQDQLVDESVGEQRVLGRLQIHTVENLQGASANIVEVTAKIGPTKDREVAAGRAGVLDRIVEAAELPVERIQVADGLHEPQLLEVRDVPEIPGERARESPNRRD